MSERVKLLADLFDAAAEWHDDEKAVITMSLLAQDAECTDEEIEEAAKLSEECKPGDLDGE